MNIIFLGAPGAGKGTQASRVAEELKLTQVATGDLFRAAQASGTELALKAKSYMEKGQLVPDEITISMVLDRISKPDCKNGVIFDGFPRNTNQAKALDKALAEQGKAIDKVVYIKVSEKELLTRLTGRWICRNCQTPYHEVNNPPKVKGKCDKCGGELYQRADDKTETIKKRLVVFFAETAPLIDYYTKAGKLIEVNGEGAVKEIEDKVLKTIKSKSANAAKK